MLCFSVSAETIDQMELGIYEQLKPRSRPTFASPMLPNARSFQNAGHDNFSPIDQADHAKLFERIHQRGGFTPLWTGTWQQPQSPNLEIINTPSLTVWIESLATTPRTLAFYLVKKNQVLSRITHRVQYHKPIYIDHPDYAMVLIVSQKHVESEVANEETAATKLNDDLEQASDQNKTLASNNID